MKAQPNQLVTVGFLDTAIAKNNKMLGAEVAKVLKSALQPLRDRIKELERSQSDATIAAMAKQIEDLRTELNVLQWRQQEAVK